MKQIITALDLLINQIDEKNLTMLQDQLNHEKKQQQQRNVSQETRLGSFSDFHTTNKKLNKHKSEIN